jgi:hypothetical protein
MGDVIFFAAVWLLTLTVLVLDFAGVVQRGTHWRLQASATAASPARTWRARRCCTTRSGGRARWRCWPGSSVGAGDQGVGHHR